MQVEIITLLSVKQKKPVMFRLMPGLDEVYEHFTGQMTTKQHWGVANALMLAWMGLKQEQREAYITQALGLRWKQTEAMARKFIEENFPARVEDDRKPEKDDSRSFGKSGRQRGGSAIGQGA